MKDLLFGKIKEALVSIMPVTLIVVILNFTPLINLSTYELIVFIVSALLLILGIGLFNLGADLSMQPMGEQVGSSLMKTRSLPLILIVCFVLGLLITIAEPDLTVLAEQVHVMINTQPMVLIATVGVGVGILIVIGIIKMLFKKDLSSILLFFYMLLFAFTALLILQEKTDLLGLAFDSGGVTTGPITVPFIMSLGIGISLTVGGKNSSENSFGLISLCSVGPILAILILGLSINGDIETPPIDYAISEDIIGTFFNTFVKTTGEVALALGLIVVFFLIIQFIYLKLPKKKLFQIGIGIIYTFLGLVIFLTAVNVGFMPIGYKMGTQIAQVHPAIAIIFGFVIGMVVVLAEPAIHVLTKQVEEVTTGGVSKKSMLIALCIGVGIAIGLSILRIIFDFSILYYLIPGYFISLGLSFFVPKLYTGIAFDSGGVASGPLTSTFILPFAIGVCMVLHGESKVLTDAFGVVAMVAMTPLITIQLLGFKSIVSKKVKNRYMMRRIISSEDEQIINF